MFPPVQEVFARASRFEQKGSNLESPRNHPPGDLQKGRRLFIGIAIELSGELGQVLGGAIKKMRIGADRHGFEMNWVPAANYHITLNFLGATDEAKLKDLERLIVEVGRRHAAFSTDLRGVGGFPDERHMRTLWIGVRHARALESLQDDLREELGRAGFPTEERSFRPHLTVAKTRKARSATDLISPFVRTRFGDVKVDRVILYESLQHGPHTSYEVLAGAPLIGSPAPDENP